MDEPHLRKHRVFPDNRGRSSRVFEVHEMAMLRSNKTYTLLSTNLSIGTVRGMHMQRGELSRPKLVTVTQGQIFDMCIDMREDSLKRGQVYMGTLVQSEGETLVIPAGFLHGYQVLETNTSVLYALDEEYRPESANNFNPMSQSISQYWPLAVSTVSEADIAAPELVIPEATVDTFLRGPN